LTNKVYEFKDHRLKEYLGDIDYYLEQRNLANLREIEKRKVVKGRPKDSNKQAYEDQRKLKSLNNKLSSIEAKISQLENEIKSIDVELATNYEQVVSNSNFFDDYKAKKDTLEALMLDWEAIHEELDKLT
jgi:ATP-binding cassette subfamily F protein 3